MSTTDDTLVTKIEELKNSINYLSDNQNKLTNQLKEQNIVNLRLSAAILALADVQSENEDILIRYDRMKSIISQSKNR